MDRAGSVYSYGGGGDRRLEIVSGKSFSGGNHNPSYMNGAQSPDPAAVAPPRLSHSRQSSSAATGKAWGFSDPDMKRKKRIAKYKVYTVEGNLKDSLKKGFRWIKNKCSQIVRGY